MRERETKAEAAWALHGVKTQTLQATGASINTREDGKLLAMKNLNRDERSLFKAGDAAHFHFVVSFVND